MKSFKQFLFWAAFLCCTFSLQAQGVPPGINYQAVVRNSKGEVISNQSIHLRISVLNPETRTYYFTETHEVSTNPVGMFTLVVGQGQPELGKFSDIPWSTANTWLEVSYDTDHNGTYEITGTTQMLSVPYAFYAERAGTAEQSMQQQVQGADGDGGDVIGEAYWQLKGNLEVDETINYLGSRNWADLVIKTHDTERMRITKGFASDQHDALVQIKEDVLSEQDVWILGMLTVEGETLLNGDLTVVGNAVFKKNIIIGQDLDVDGFLHVKKDADFDANVNIDLNLHVGNDADIDHNLNVDNDTHIGNNLDVDNNANVDVDLHVGNNVDIDNNLNVDNDTHIGSDLDVDGNGNIDMNLHVGKDADIDNNLNVDNDTHIGNDLDVDGNGNIDMNLHVGKDADIDNNLNVDNDTHIGGDLDVDGTGNIDLDLHVGEDLDVDQNVNIDNDLTVQNNAYILGDLEVAGEGSFFDLSIQNNLTVGNDVDIDNNLNVDNSITVGVDLTVTDDVTIGDDLTVTGTSLFEGAVTMENNLTVNQNLDVDNNLNVDNDVTIGGDLNVDNPITANCRLVVNSCVTGSDSDIDNYPVVVQGGDQGVAIKVSGTRSTDNNYVAFWDANGIQGRIEGQTYDELLSSFDFIWSNAMSAAEEAFSIAMVVACGLSVPPDVAESIVWGVEGLLTLAEWIEYNVSITENVGVAYESGSGDYAEWLERANPMEDYQFGEIVGVRGGKISRNTLGADHVMVVSKAPIVLGNMPQPTHEKDYEMVAFMGQVPVRVMGKVAVGDYILPSGFNDGYARAVSPLKMQIDDYSKIVGVAWQAGNATPMNLVNVAVGINNNDLAAQITRQQQELNLMKQQMNQVFALLGQKSPYENVDAPALTPATTAPVADAMPAEKQQTLDQFSKMVHEHPEVLVNAFADAKTKLLAQNVDVNKYPEIARIFDQPVEWIKEQSQKGYLNDMILRAKAQVEAKAGK